MLKDIKNVMGSKRTHNIDFSPPHGLLIDAVTGKKYEISPTKKFIIGRSLTCSVIVEKLYISRNHCIINYENNNFVVYDNTTGTGTFLNCEKLPKEKKTVVLKHGDLISFGESKKMEFIFKFCLPSNAEKRIKLDKSVEDSTMDITNLDENNKNLLTKLHSEILNLKVDKLVLSNSIRCQISEFKKMLDSTVQYAIKFSKEVNKQSCNIKELTNKVSEYQSTLMLQQECLDGQQESSTESFKNQVHNILDNDFQCPICNEILVKASLTHACGHTFCGSCITEWLGKSNICPVCRAPVQATTSCLTVDNFITNVCNLIGGTVQEQRENLQKERIVPRSSRRGRKRTKIPRRQETIQFHLNNVMPLYNAAALYPTIRSENIEIVDLTHTPSI